MVGWANYKVVKILTLTAFLMTLVVTPSLSHDPINWIKMLILSTGVLSAFMLFILNGGFAALDLSTKIFFALFIGVSVASILFSSSDFQSSFWGIWGRATGFLTYLCLGLVVLLGHVFNDDKGISRVIRVFFSVSILEICYMLVQYFDRDFFAWTRNETFGTLGNINFSSAFVGIFLAASLPWITNEYRKKEKSRLTLMAFATIFLMGALLILRSGSVQGLIMVVYATLIWISLELATVLRINLALKYSLVAVLNLCFTLLIFTTTRQSFFGGVFFQDTMAYRRDYWVAAKNIIVENPLFGVGFDSYGLWYRSARDLLGATRTSVNRVSDSAHSIFLDISVSAGIVMMALMMLLIFITFKRVVIIFHDRAQYKWKVVALAWLAYFPQFIFGINQLGVGVWGWMFMGILVFGYPRANHENNSSDKKGQFRLKTKDERETQLPASKFLITSAAGLLGFILAFPPLFADTRFQGLYPNGSLQELEKVATSLGGSRYAYEKVLELATQTGQGEAALGIANRIIERYPRSDYAWRIIFGLKVTPEAVRKEAEQKLNQLDPYLLRFPPK
jgi:O-antigen ligase